MTIEQRIRDCQSHINQLLDSKLPADSVAPERLHAAMRYSALDAGKRLRPLLVLLEDHGVMASAASSCASGALQPSHVLVAMGRSDDAARGALRLSMGHSSTDADVDVVVEALPSCIDRLAG